MFVWPFVKCQLLYTPRDELPSLKLNPLIKPSEVIFSYVAGCLATWQNNVFNPGQSQKFASYFSCMGTLYYILLDLVTTPLLIYHLFLSPSHKYLTTSTMSSCLPPIVCMIHGGFTREIPFPPIAKTMPMLAPLSMTPPCSRLVVVLHLFALPLPPILLSTLPPLDASPSHVAPAISPSICLWFALTGCHVASCFTSASHLPAHPPLRLHLLLHLVFVHPG